jgi:hypothetical protein
MTDPLREAAISRLAQYKLRKNIAAVLDAAWREGLDQKQLNEVAHIDTILAALPTDAVQPVGGVDREAVDVVEEWLAMAEQCSLVGATGVLRYPPICTSEIAAIRRLALYATAPTAWGGWVMVPREPTEAMMRAFWQMHFAEGPKSDADCYRAMITAAPTVGEPS